MKKGYTLAVVLVVVGLISSAAIMTYNSASLHTKITHNDRLYKQARLNAQSGLTHFLSKRHHYEDLVEIGSGQEEFLLLQTAVTDKDYYQVHVRMMPGEKFEVTSHGVVTIKGRTVSSASIKATFKSEWIKRGENKNE